METHNLTQGSKEWVEFRTKLFNASDAPAMMNKSKYKSRNELLETCKLGIAKDVDAVTQKRFDDGHKFEDMQRTILEKEMDEELYPVVATLEIDGMSLGASLDGVDMLETFLFEHKTINNDLKGVQDIADLDDMYKIQMQQQMLVSGCDKCLFVASDGTAENRIKLWYYSDKDLESKIIAGWKQFQKDLETFEPKKSDPVIEKKSIEDLPSIRVEVFGEVRESNLADYKSAAIEFINNINTDLVTDEDFGHAENMVKFCSNVEKKLVSTKEHILEKTESIDDLFKTIDYLSGEFRNKRLYLNKLVKDRKEEIKRDLINQAQSKLQSHYTELNKVVNNLMPPMTHNLAGCAKGKRSIKSIDNAIDSEVARVKIETDEIARDLTQKLDHLNTKQDYMFLFNDLKSLSEKPFDDFCTTIELRITQHKEAEKQKAETERDRIREEEKRKLEEKQSEQVKPVEKKQPVVAQPDNSDYEHRKQVHNDLVSEFVKLGINEELSVKLIKSIVRNKYKHLQIVY